MIHWWTSAEAILAKVQALLGAYPEWSAEQVADMASILQRQEVHRKVFVVPLGSPGTTSEGNGRIATLSQRFGIVFAVQAANDLSGARRRNEAGQVIWYLLPRLMGWSPGSGWTALTLTAAPSQDYIAEEYAYYPFAFETSVQIHAVRT